MANVKITELPANTNPSGKEEFVYARSNSNGKMTLDTIKKFVGNGGGGGGGDGTRTDEIFAPGVLPDSVESNTWIFTSDGLHGCEFVGSQANVYEMATAFDVDGENTLITTVTAPGDINMGQLHDEGTRLILLGYKSSWRIMYGINADEGGTVFQFDPNSPEYTYSEYENRGEQVPYFKSTTDLASGDYADVVVYSASLQSDVPLSDLKFIGMCYNNREYRYAYCPETDEYCTMAVGIAEWNEPGSGGTYHNLQTTRITAILNLSDGWSGPTYMYGDPLQAGTDGWYRVYGYSEYYRPSYPDSEDQFFADGNGSIGTINDTVQFIGGNQKYLSSDRYLGYDTTKQIVTTYNVKGYGNPDADDTINVPSFNRFNSEISNLQTNKQNKFDTTPEFTKYKATKANPNPWGASLYLNGLYSVSFYQNGTIALLSSSQVIYCGSVTNPYEITQEELEDIVNNSGYADVGFHTGGQCFLSEDGDKLIAKAMNNQTIYVYSLDTSFDLTSISSDPIFYASDCDSYIFNYDGTALWKWEWDVNDQCYYWNLYTGSDYEYDNFSFVEHQGSLDLNGLKNNQTCIAFSFDGEYLIAGGDNAYKIMLYKLSTPWDLSTATLFHTLENGSYNFWQCYCGIPTEDFVYAAWRNQSHQDSQSIKYSYDPSVIYPSMGGVINGVADAYKPVEVTLDSNPNYTIGLYDLNTSIIMENSSITINVDTLLPGMNYIIHVTVNVNGNISFGNGIFIDQDLPLASYPVSAGDRFILTGTAINDTELVLFSTHITGV